MNENKKATQLRMALSLNLNEHLYNQVHNLSTLLIGKGKSVSF